MTIATPSRLHYFSDVLVNYIGKDNAVRIVEVCVDERAVHRSTTVEHDPNLHVYWPDALPALPPQGPM
jgi:hypothetical protein